MILSVQCLASKKYYKRKFHITVLLLYTERKELIPHKNKGLKELSFASEHVQGMKLTIKTLMCFNNDILKASPFKALGLTLMPGYQYNTDFIQLKGDQISLL